MPARVFVLGGAGHSVDLRCVVHTGSLVEVGVGDVHLDIAGGQAVFLFHLFRSEGRDCHSAYQHSGRKCTCKYFFNLMITHLYLGFEKTVSFS